MSKNMEIMDMPSGTKIRNKKNGYIYTLGDWDNQYSRVITNDKILTEPFRTDYINRCVQNNYEVVEEKEN